MSDFKIGDRVRVIDIGDCYQGREGEITGYGEGRVYPFTVTLSEHESGIYNSREIAHVKGARPNKLKVVPDVPEAVEHPAHYGGGDNPYEVIKVAEAWGLDKDAYLFNVIKYVGRAGKKGDTLEDLKKSRFYLDRRIKQLETASD